LSIDLDGNDYWILKEADLDDASLVMVETNPLFGGAVPVSIPQNDEFSRFAAHPSGLYWGTSIAGWTHLLESRDFRLVGRNRKGFNAFFVRKDIVARDPLLTRFADTVDLSSQTWGVREGRNALGKLTFADPFGLVRESPELPLVNVVTGETMQLGQLFED